MSKKGTAASGGPASGTERTDLLRQLAAGSQLLAIDTLHFVAKRRDQAVGQLLSPIDSSTAAVESKFEAMQPTLPPVDACSFLVRGLVRFVSHGEGEQPAAEISIVLRLTYSFAGRTEPLSNDELGQFANQVAVHHAWPFMRERVVTACQLIGVPPHVLPLRKLTA